MYHVGLLVRTGAHVCQTGSDSTGNFFLSIMNMYYIIIARIHAGEGTYFRTASHPKSRRRCAAIVVDKSHGMPQEERLKMSRVAVLERSAMKCKKIDQCIMLEAHEVINLPSILLYF